MGFLRIDRLLEAFTGTELLLGLLWAGVAALSIALVVLMRTRWGQSHALRKCLVLSGLAHVLLAGYAATVQIVTAVPHPPHHPTLEVFLDDGDLFRENEVRPAEDEPRPWDRFVHALSAGSEPSALERPPQPELPETDRSPPSLPPASELPSLDHLSLAESPLPDPAALIYEPTRPAAVPAEAPQAIDAPAPQRREAPPPPAPGREAPARLAPADSPTEPPQRSETVGVPASLLERPAPLPRLDTLPVDEDPGAILRGLADLLPVPPRGQPAEAVAEPGPLDDTRPGGAPKAAPHPTHVGRLAPPSLEGIPGIGQPGGSIRIPEAALPGIAPTLLPPQRRSAPASDVPEVYRLRVAPDRSRQALARGATEETEAAVRAALRWLAENQSPDGRWDGRRHGAGRELFVLGRSRQNAGIRSDTGMTGLALLAFLGSGHTHERGDYQEHVRRGLEYLIRAQAEEGHLGGEATLFAFMYCHAMGTFALSETYALSGDARLREPVRRAVDYTLAAQDPDGGGWRYRPREPGDTSQIGWQMMVLRSAELAGVPVPQSAWNGADRFLESVSSGRHRGLAAYRPGEAPSRAMTAEALFCRQLLGLGAGHPAALEAAEYLLHDLPGQGDDNVYLWYYATLALHQVQGEPWTRWNDALRNRLLATQVTRGPHAGSWEPDTLWGGYGGRVYSTALSAMCLQVYYRYLPLYRDRVEKQ